MKLYIVKNLTFYIDYLVGALFVLFHTATRFNTPPTNRSSTTAGRYFFGITAYSAIALGIYLLLACSPCIINYLLTGEAGKRPDFARDFSPPLVSAMVLTLLLPKIPFLSAVDSWICRSLQTMAAIPFEVRRLSAEMRKARMHLAPEEEESFRGRLEEEGFKPMDALFEDKRCPQYLWTLVSVLHWRIEDWESDRRMAGYVSSSTGELERLRKKRQQLVPKAKACFRLMEESMSGDATDKAHEAVFRFKEDFMEQLSILRDGTLEFISRGILQCELTDVARNRRLDALGYKVDWVRQRLTLNQLMLLFSVLSILMLSVMVWSATSKGTPIGILLVRAVMVSVSYLVAVACVVFPKEKWKMAQHRAGDVPPMAFYLVAGIMAVVISQAIIFLFNGLVFWDFHIAWVRSRYTYPWSTLTFVTSVMTGLLIDDLVKPTISHKRRRYVEGLVQGVATALAGLLVYGWLLQTATGEVAKILGCVLPPLPMMVIVPGLVGFAIGTTVPTWYREAPRQVVPLENERLDTGIFRIPAYRV